MLQAVRSRLGSVRPAELIGYGVVALTTAAVSVGFAVAGSLRAGLLWGGAVAAVVVADRVLP